MTHTYSLIPFGDHIWFDLVDAISYVQIAGDKSLRRLLSFHVHTRLADMIKDDSLQLIQVMVSCACLPLLLGVGGLIKRWFVLILILSVCVLSPNHLVPHLTPTVTHTFNDNNKAHTILHPCPDLHNPGEARSSSSPGPPWTSPSPT